MIVISEVVSVSPWEAFGLPGLVIAASFVALGVLGRYLMNGMRDMRLEHHAERITWRAEDKVSKNEWNDTLREISTQNTAALREVKTELVHAITDSTAKACKSKP